MRIICLLRIFLIAAVIVFSAVAGSAREARRNPDYQSVQLSTIGCYPNAGWMYGVRFYVFLRPADVIYGSIRWIDAPCSFYTEYQPFWAADIGMHIIHPLYPEQPWAFDVSLRWHSFQFRNYKDTWWHQWKYKLRKNMIVSIGYTREFSSEPAERVNAAFWWRIPRLHFGIPHWAQRFGVFAFVQYNHSLHGDLPSYVFPVQGGLNLVFRIAAWPLK